MGGLKINADSPLIERYACLVDDIFGVTDRCTEHSELLPATVDALLEKYFEGTQFLQAVRLRYGLQGNDPMTYEQVGSAMGISGNRARQIIQEGLRHLRHPYKTAYLKRFRPDMQDEDALQLVASRNYTSESTRIPIYLMQCVHGAVFVQDRNWQCQTCKRGFLISGVMLVLDMYSGHCKLGFEPIPGLEPIKFAVSGQGALAKQNTKQDTLAEQIHMAMNSGELDWTTGSKLLECNLDTLEADLVNNNVPVLSPREHNQVISILFPKRKRDKLRHIVSALAPPRLYNTLIRGGMFDWPLGDLLEFVDQVKSGRPTRRIWQFGSHWKNELRLILDHPEVVAWLEVAREELED